MAESSKIVIIDEQAANRIYLQRVGKGPVHLMYWDLRKSHEAAAVGEVRELGKGSWEFSPIGWEHDKPIKGSTSVKCAHEAILPFLYSNFRPVLKELPGWAETYGKDG